MRRTLSLVMFTEYKPDMWKFTDGDVNSIYTVNRESILVFGQLLLIYK